MTAFGTRGGGSRGLMLVSLYGDYIVGSCGSLYVLAVYIYDVCKNWVVKE